MITIDFETYYRTQQPDKYTIMGSTTEEYIRDPRFQVTGFAYAIDDAPPVWVTGTDDHIESALRSLDWNTVVVAHNTRFDGAILAWRYGIHPRVLACTMTMAEVTSARRMVGGKLEVLAKTFGLGVKGEELGLVDGMRREDIPPDIMQRYAGYCVNDVELTRALYKMLKPHLTLEDMRFISMTLRMYTRPVFVLDTPLLSGRLDAVVERKREAREQLAAELGADEQDLGVLLRSNETFTEFLRAWGVEPGMKPSPANPTRQIHAYAKTDKFMADLLEHHDPRVVTLAQVRMGEQSSIEETRLRRFLSIGQRGKILPIPLDVSGAHTGRYSGKGRNEKGDGEKVNIQNLPKRGGRDTTLRQSMCAPPGHVVVAADSSQIELRVAAYIADHQRLLNLFRTGDDPYAYTAQDIYGTPAQTIKDNKKVEPYKTQRDVGKQTSLSCVYAVGKDKLRESLRQQKIVLSVEEATRAVMAYRTGNPEITSTWQMLDNVLTAMARGEEGQFGGPNKDLIQFRQELVPWRTKTSPYILLPNGTRIWYHGLAKERVDGLWEWRYWQKDQRRIYGGAMFENLCQGFAFAVLRWQALELEARGVPIHMNVHDEWASVVPKEQEEYAMNAYQEVMSCAPPWAPGLPLACDVGAGANYGEV